MLTRADKKFLTEKFATKDDLQGMEKRIKKDIKHVKDSLDLAIGVFDKQGVYHHKRLVNLEKKTGLDEQPYMPLVN